MACIARCLCPPWAAAAIVSVSRPLQLASWSQKSEVLSVWGNTKHSRKTQNAGRVGVGDDDLYDVEDVLDDHIESALDMLDDADKSVDDPLAPFAPPLALPVGEEERAVGVGDFAAGTIVDYKINEDEFHKIQLLDCDFFIRKVPDPDDDVYDFNEMYVTPPDTDVYSIPQVIGKMPRQKARCTKSKWDRICLVLNKDPRNNPRAPMGKNEFRVIKVFLIKHFNNRRGEAENFLLNFEKVYVIDGATKSIRKAKVKIDVPGGKDRDRSKEVLTVRDGGTSFRIILREEVLTPDEVIEDYEWNKTRREMEEYLKSFRDFEISNWF